MKDRLRELAKGWKLSGAYTSCASCANELLDILDAEGDGRYSQGVCGDGAAILRDGERMTVDEIVAALNAKDSEGDGGAVPCQDALIYAGDQYTDKYKDDDRQDIKTDVLNAFYQGANWMRKNNLARSGVVSEDDVSTIAKMIADRFGNGMREKYEELAKQIAEHFAKGERHER